MTWYMLPALIGLLAKVFLLVCFRNKDWVSPSLIGFVSVFAMQNIVELILLAGFNSNAAGELTIRTYYVSIVCVLIYGLFYVTADFETFFRKAVKYAVSLLSVIMVLLILVTDLVVSGVTSIEYSYTAQRGSNYYLFSLFSLGCLILWLMYLVDNYLNSKSAKSKIKNLYALLALLPLAFGSIFVVASMMMGININATMIVPIASTIFLVILSLGRNSSYIRKDPRAHMPGSLESDLHSCIERATVQYSLGNINHKRFMRDTERAALVYKLRTNESNVSRTAADIEVKRETMYSKFRSLNIQRNSS